MADLGKVSVTDAGDYSASVTYEKLTFVHYLGDAYMTLKTVQGVTPSDDGVNYRLFCRSAEIATTGKAGILKPAETDFTVGEDGTLGINTQFTQAATLANIIAGEAIAEVLGKVSKAIATTMNLDQNALLKSMLTSIDVNDANKVPTAAYIHTLVERIGMGDSLAVGSNLTNAVNSLNSSFSAIETNIKTNGTCIAGNLHFNIYKTKDELKNLSVKFYDSHKFCLILCDFNNYSDLYMVGTHSQVSTILKTSDNTVPSFNSDGTLGIKMKQWYNIVIISLCDIDFV